MKYTPPTSFQGNSNIEKKPRSSNLELYRIICMLMIVAHHYVVNSGLSGNSGPCAIHPNDINTLFLKIFSAWGKTGINCFMMITGYFMCTSKITARKFIKLLAQVYFYNVLIYIIFLVSGYETISSVRIVKLLMPFWGFNSNFVSCFIIFYLTIPFLTILVRNLNKRQHELLLMILIGSYTIFGSIPSFNVTFNYITWFCVIFFIASYIRYYPTRIFESRKKWGVIIFVSVLSATISIIFLQRLFGAGDYFLSNCNRVLAVVVSVSSFLWFKNMNIRYNKVVNAFGAGTFGVLLIHANSDAMRTWLWDVIIDTAGHYNLPLVNLVFFSVGVVIAIFITCNLMDQLRISFF